MTRDPISVSTVDVIGYTLLVLAALYNGLYPNDFSGRFAGGLLWVMCVMTMYSCIVIFNKTLYPSPENDAFLRKHYRYSVAYWQLWVRRTGAFMLMLVFFMFDKMHFLFGFGICIVLVELYFPKIHALVNDPSDTFK